MKKLINLLVIGTLFSTSIPSANMVINTNLKQKLNRSVGLKN